MANGDSWLALLHAPCETLGLDQLTMAQVAVVCLKSRRCYNLDGTQPPESVGWVKGNHHASV